MRAPDFIHLRVHTEYSIADSIVRVDALVDAALLDRQPAVAITDAANLFGWIKFYKAARSKGVKPLLGVDAWLSNDADRDRPFRILLLARDHDGYRSLCELLSRAWLDNEYRGRGELRTEWFDEGLSRGLIMLSGAHSGDVGQALLAGNREAAAELARAWARRFPGAYYLELQRTGAQDAETQTRAAAQLAAGLALPVVATHPVQFVGRDGFSAHEARVCIAEGEILANPRRPKRFTEQQYFKSQAEMRALFADLPSALANSVEIARRCNVQMTLGKAQLPQFPTPEGVTLDDYMRQLAREGLAQRMLKLFPDPGERAAQAEAYARRLDYECDTIVQMGFSGYFLIVADFINWAKANEVPVGPGRGSGAGSLVAFALGITDLDPIPYALLFERFLNPERVSMPDFDIDFCQDNRWKVIEYVRRKYGEQAVSQIATFGTMASKAVIRDVGRVLDMGYNFCDQLSKLIPVVQNKPVSLAKAREAEPMLAEREEREDEVRGLLALAEPLEDLTRNVGMHAGGVLIAPGRLTDFCPLYKAPGTDSVISQYDKDDVEAVGLVKFDFLGLRNLTIIQMAVEYINARHPGLDLDLSTLSFDDPKAYQVLKEANTIAIFQVESDGMKKLLKKLQPDRFEDIIAVLALYRPGPLGSGMVDDFILRKKGQQRIDYFHPDLKGTLEPTYGVIVYQEQVMQIAQTIGGYTLGGADLLRRAMGKKKAEEMAQQRGIFVDGRAEEGLRDRPGEQAVRPDGDVRRVRLQQVAHRRLRGRHLPDGVAQGALSGRVLRRDAVVRHGRHRQGAAVRDRREGQQGRRSPARHQRVGAALRAGLGSRDPLRTGRGEGERRERGRLRRADPTAGALPRPLRLLRAHRPKGGEPAGRRGAGACRRVRFHRFRPREAAGQRRHGDRRGRGARGRHQPGEPVRHRRRRRWRADRMAARRALDRASAAPGGEERARVLPERTPVPRLRGRGAALRSHAPGGSAAFAAAAVDRGNRLVAAHADDQARQDEHRAPRRRQRFGRGVGLQRSVRTLPPR